MLTRSSSSVCHRNGQCFEFSTAGPTGRLSHCSHHRQIHLPYKRSGGGEVLRLKVLELQSMMDRLRKKQQQGRGTQLRKATQILAAGEEGGAGSKNPVQASRPLPWRLWQSFLLRGRWTVDARIPLCAKDPASKTNVPWGHSRPKL